MAKKNESEKLNPFDQGVGYPEFLEQLGKSTVKDHCKDMDLTNEQIEWLENEIVTFKNQK